LGFGKHPRKRSEWAPSVDIIEDEKEWLVKADLPEVNKDLIVNRV